MAQAGGGHFYFIADAVQIADHIATEVGELLAVVARDVAIEVTAADGLDVRTLSPYPMDVRGNRRLVLVGEVMAEQVLEVVLRIKFPYGEIGSEVGVLVGAVDRDGLLLAAGATPVGVGWQYADDAANDAQPRDRSVDRVVAGLFAARARQEAIKLNRLGDYREAVAELHGVARRIAAYAFGDPELGRIVAELESEKSRWAAPAPEMTRKVAFAASSYALHSRTSEGRARRNA
jgi:Ca-activated chloride channel family protein